MFHAQTDLLHQGKDDQGCDGMRDERRDHQDQPREDDQHPVQAETSHFLRDGLGDRVQQTRRRHRLAQTQTPRGEDDDRPQEVVEVLLGQDARAEKQHHRNDRDHAHVAKRIL